jgi:hypothetical protein
MAAMNQHVRSDIPDCRTLMAMCLVIAIALGGCATERKAASVSYGLSGFEIFIGDREGNRTTGVLFSGWVHDPKPGWQPKSNPNSFWVVSANYTGTPGIGGSVDLTGGKWLLAAGDAVLIGTIAGGTIAWPKSLNVELSGHKCGEGIGYVDVAVVNERKGHREGRVTGCLDDTHVQFGTFPPKIWGTLTIP